MCESVVWFSSSAAIIHYIRFSFSVKSTAELGTRRASPLAAHTRDSPGLPDDSAAPSHESERYRAMPRLRRLPHPLPRASLPLYLRRPRSIRTIPPIISGLGRTPPGRPVETKGRRGDLTVNRLLLLSSSTRRPGLPWHPWLFLGWSRSPSLNAAASPHERGRLHRSLMPPSPLPPTPMTTSPPMRPWSLTHRRTQA